MTVFRDYFRTTKATPITAINMPTIPAKLKLSPKINHAMIAVVGGVKYIRLVTLVAALLRIKANNRKIAPIDRAKIDHNKAPINCGVHCTAVSAGVACSRNIASGKISSKEAANWTMAPVRKSNCAQYFF